MKKPRVAITFGVVVGALMTNILWLPNGADRYSLIGLLAFVLLIATFWEDIQGDHKGE